MVVEVPRWSNAKVGNNFLVKRLIKVYKHTKSFERENRTIDIVGINGMSQLYVHCSVFFL